MLDLDTSLAGTAAAATDLLAASDRAAASMKKLDIAALKKAAG
jgi:hypothetical protein